LVVPRLLRNGGPWTLSSHAAQQEQKDRRYRRRGARRTSSAIQRAIQSGNSLSSTQSRSLCVASKSKSVYLGLNAADAPIVIDSRASLSISPHRGDFVGDIEQLNSTIQGISTVTKIAGVGTVRWTFKDVFGTITIIETRAYYIPDAGVHLFSSQVYFQEQHAGSYLMTSTNTVLTTAEGCVLTLGCQLGRNLPMVPPPAVCALSRVNHSRVNLSFEGILSDSVACSLSLIDKDNAYKRLYVKLMVNCPSSLPSIPELDPASLHSVPPVAWPRRRTKDPILIEQSRTPRKYILWFVTISSLATESL
jgi:hypothetical protein